MDLKEAYLIVKTWCNLPFSLRTSKENEALETILSFCQGALEAKEMPEEIRYD